MPKHPQHENCDCKKINIGAPSAVADCDINKFIVYFSINTIQTENGIYLSNWGLLITIRHFLNFYTKDKREKYLSAQLQIR